MHVRVTPSHWDPAREKEVVRFIEERLIPVIRQLPGFHRYTGGVERATGHGVALTEWDDLQHAQDFRTALGGLVQEIADQGITLEAAQIYEVPVQT
jgi:hypothetical protein